ncbi:hypothetical protein BDV29DRAFT_165243 [Aspergillus leporis]|uniref:Uncharacterized protein n=1 Tax=Aspergillus leporis TaxID=41062 RepID=A0A5N5XFW1_9EURO|nr:hypothetical protein BDV29DRAFT_165243 [Aspergillus leporis]
MRCIALLCSSFSKGCVARALISLFPDGKLRQTQDYLPQNVVQGRDTGLSPSILTRYSYEPCFFSAVTADYF